MTIVAQSRDEKLQYDINREATKVSALSSSKIGKYEYLTGKEILSSNQQQVIEQAIFTYFPLRKAYEKQIKIIEDQGKKQVEALENLKDRKKQLVNAYDYEDKLSISKEGEIFKNIYNKRLDKIEELTKNIDDNNLKFITTSRDIKTDFNKKYNPLNFLNKIKKSKITIEEAKESQKDFDHYFKRMRKEKKTQEQEKTLANLNVLFNGRNDAINFIEGYGSMILEAKRKAAEEPTEQDGTGLKILTLKKILQRLPMAHEQLKAGNNSKNLFNEIRQIVYSLYQSKQITKKVYNNIIKSIQL